MKQISKTLFIVVAILSVLLFVVSITGLRSSYGDRTTNIINGAHMVPRGFGLENNAVIYMQLDSESDVELNFSYLKKVLEKRLEFSSVLEYEVYPDIENNAFSIVLPLDSSVGGNLGVLGQALVAPGKFELREGAEIDEDGNPTGISENVVLTNEHIDYVRPMTASGGLQGTVYYLDIELTREGRKILTERARQMIANSPDENPDELYFTVWINDKAQDYFSAPAMDGAKVIASFSDSDSGYSMEDMTLLSISLTGGYLNVPLRLYDIIADHDAAYLGDNTSTLLVIAFAGILAVVGVILILRYKGIGLAGFTAILGMYGIIFLFITNFYGDYTKNQITTATFGGLLIVLLFATILIIKDGEAVLTAIKSGVAQNKAYADTFENNLTPSVVAYSAMAFAGFFLMDIFKRAGGVTSQLVKLVLKDFSNRRFTIIGNFGWLLMIAGIFGVIMMVFIYRLLVRSTMSLSKGKTLALPKKMNSKDFSIISKKWIYIAIVAVIIVAGSFLALTVGFGSSMENTGGHIMTARFTAKYDFETNSREEIYNDILSYFDNGSKITGGEYSNYYYEIISVHSPTPIDINVEEFSAAMNEKYEGLLVEGYTEVYNLQKSFSFDEIYNFMILLAAVVILGIALVAITMGIRSALIAGIGLVVNSILTLSVMVFIRIPAGNAIFSGVAVSVIAGFIYSIFNLSTYNNVSSRSKKTNRFKALNDASNSNAVTACIYSIILTIGIAVFAVVGLIMGASIQWYSYSAILFLSLLLPQFYSTFIIPGVYVTKEN